MISIDQIFLAVKAKYWKNDLAILPSGYTDRNLGEVSRDHKLVSGKRNTRDWLIELMVV